MLEIKEYLKLRYFWFLKDFRTHSKISTTNDKCDFQFRKDLPADLFLDGTGCSRLPVFNQQTGEPQTWPNGDPIVMSFFNFCYNEDLGVCQCPPGSNTGVGSTGLVCTEEDACIGINRCHLGSVSFH